MRSLSVPLEEAREQFIDQAEQLMACCAGLDDLDLLDPSRCRGWSRLDLVVHVRIGLEEMAASTGVRSALPPDHDAASYWASYPDDRQTTPVEHILWLRRTAAAYGRPSGAVRHLVDATDSACAAVGAMPDEVVLFQGKSMTAGDFIATWVVELAVHLLDLDIGVTPVRCGVARRTIETVAGASLPGGLADDRAVLVGLGRLPWPADAARPTAYPVSF